MKRVGDIDGLLARRRIQDEKDLAGLGRRRHGPEFSHQRLVDRQTTRRVHDEDVQHEVPTSLEGVPGDARGIRRRFSEYGNAHLLAEHFELVDCGGSLKVACGKHGPLALPLEPERQLRAGRRLARPLEATHEHDGRRSRAPLEPSFLSSEQFGQFVADDANQGLVGVEAPVEFLANGLLLHLGHELLGDLEVDVRLEESHPHFAQHFGDVVFAESAFTAQAREHASEAPSKGVEHRRQVYRASWIGNIRALCVWRSRSCCGSCTAS